MVEMKPIEWVQIGGGQVSPATYVASEAASLEEIVALAERVRVEEPGRWEGIQAWLRYWTRRKTRARNRALNSDKWVQGRRLAMRELGA